ncbi:hypothetical protein J2X31_002835 [Flavobacterium arsenatis]|uniref:Uncharacterized protein n=1 Tax=Flavobacterium arsenatis TaxID=1484332 RepID=A0ABU1TSI0_9FLAO|nr:hypothetical protein [Flavobacterium arsenatis]MDR6968809.1 hypothetical protein [Flavobacterium arsenatis]
MSNFDYKKSAVLLLALIGVGLMSKGFLGVFDLHFQTIENGNEIMNTSYYFGYNTGLVLAKIGKIAVGFLMLKYCYEWFCIRKINLDDFQK